uniref:Uncharacterized protein n=1 Tax=uncultured Chloroflexi bacterium HF0200_06I16 TaxID=710735 RepID=E0XU08_9CHLR|nr:hypothetical protein [uncultured Chloroflexi bacterium HF0200_06I16]
MFAVYAGPKRHTRKVTGTIRTSVKWRAYFWALKQRSTMVLAYASGIRFSTPPEVKYISYAPNSENTFEARFNFSS